MTTNIFSSIFTAHSRYLNPINPESKNSFLHLAVAIRNIARQNQGAVLSKLKDELDEYFNGKQVQSDSAFSKLSQILNQLLKKQGDDEISKKERPYMPQIIPPRPDNCDTYFSSLTEQNIDSNIEKNIEEYVKQGQNGLNDFITTIRTIVTNGQFFLEGCGNVCKQEEFENYIKRLFYLLIRFNETIGEKCLQLQKKKCTHNQGSITTAMPSYQECLARYVFSKRKGEEERFFLRETIKPTWCSFSSISDIILFLSKPTNNSLNYEINTEICCSNSTCESHQDTQIEFNTLTGAQTDMSVFKSFNIALITLLHDSDSLFGTGISSDYTGCKNLVIQDFQNLSLIKSDSLKNISQKILVSKDAKVIDGHHNWAGFTIAFSIVGTESRQVTVKQVSLSFEDYYNYAMAHPLVFSMDYNDNYVSRVRQRQRGGGDRRRYKKKSRQRGGKRSRKANRSNKSVRKVKGRKTNKFRKRKVTLKNMSPRLLEAFSTLNR